MLHEPKEEFVCLQRLAKEANYPILKIVESTNMEFYPHEDFPDRPPNYSGTFTIDTKVFASKDENELFSLAQTMDYVGSIVETALLGNDQTTTSRKCSFGDIPDWWDEFAPRETEGRETRTINVAVNH